TPALLAILRSNSTTSFGTMAVTEFKLKSSILGPGGPTYTDIGAYPLH
ncbi:MAG: RNA 2',3'-cyclic phosphodiesterase, partial [Thaumarchaeota archaeon]|nr:RNA 2',3'-cyclic phosphodiesterase [Nitrososphaerota archaeon]